jgi:hypothetical protein
MVNLLVKKLMIALSQRTAPPAYRVPADISCQHSSQLKAFR